MIPAGKRDNAETPDEAGRETHMIKNKTRSATYNGSIWRGSLGTLEPGKGYIYWSNASEDKTLIFSDSQK